MHTTVRSIESVTEDYSQSLLERGFNKGSLRTIKPFHTTGLCFTNRIILGLVISGNLEVQTSLSVNHFISDEEFCFLPICIFRCLQEYWVQLFFLLVRNSKSNFLSYMRPRSLTRFFCLVA